MAWVCVATAKKAPPRVGSRRGFAAATTAVPVGGDIWLGTNRGEMIAYFPAPQEAAP